MLGFRRESAAGVKNVFLAKGRGVSNGLAHG